jgi:hypothetical protein
MWMKSALFAAVLVLAACGQPGTTMPVPLQPAIASAASGPPACKGQRTKPQYGSITVSLKAKSGAFCIPAFGGFGGSLPYPGVDRSVKLTIRTSTTNIYREPQLGSGLSMVYLNLHFHAGTHFGARPKSSGGLESQAIHAGDPYTAYGIVAVGHLVLMFPPCYAIATQGPYGGVVPKLGHLLSNATITGAGYGVIEIYSGEQVTQAC